MRKSSEQVMQCRERECQDDSVWWVGIESGSEIHAVVSS